MLTAVNVTFDYPLTGIGADNFPIVSLRYSVFEAEPHSLWLKCSSEYGLPMIVFFALFVILILVRLRRRANLARAIGDTDGEAIATALNCSLFGFLATGTFTSQFLSEYMWAIIGLIGAFLATPLEPAAGIAPGLEREAEVVAAAGGESAA
jgi:O-antigen ligase